MSSIATALQSISPDRELVALYYHRPTDCLIVTGIAKSNGGAMIVDASGQIVRTCSSKREALASLQSRLSSLDPASVDLQALLRLQEVRGSRAWAEQQIRMTSGSRGPVPLKRVNAFLVANGYPEVEA